MQSSNTSEAVSPPARTELPPRQINLIVVHCSATASGAPIARGTAGVAGYRSCADVVDAWHAERGFVRRSEAAQAYNPTLGHIGYHYVVDIDGQVYTGRSLGEVGAHVAGHNTASIGICLVGGAEKDARYTRPQWKSLSSLVLWQTTEQRIPLSPPLRNGDLAWSGVCGHRDLSPDTNHDGVISPAEWLKTCPGFDVTAWLNNRLQPFASAVLP